MRKGKANASTSVKYAILGLLIKRPSYPYELANTFYERIGSAWELNKGQVYQTVYRLEEEGLVERTPSKPNAHGIRWIYSVTERGREVFERWRQGRPDRVRPMRDELLVRIALATPEDIPSLLEVIETTWLLPPLVPAPALVRLHGGLLES